LEEGAITMLEEETFVISDHADIGAGRTMQVRIAEHNHGEYWQVSIGPSDQEYSAVVTTIETDDSFLWYMIHNALRGDRAAWNDLGHLGSRPSFRCARVGSIGQAVVPQLTPIAN
jgi:hypothetical protein